jgi:hypothetical protein
MAQAVCAKPPWSRGMPRYQKDPRLTPQVGDGSDVRPATHERARFPSRIEALTGIRRGARLSLDEAIEEALRDA